MGLAPLWIVCLTCVVVVAEEDICLVFIFVYFFFFRWLGKGLDELP